MSEEDKSSGKSDKKGLWEDKRKQNKGCGDAVETEWSVG